jgi:hypothetical protein
MARKWFRAIVNPVIATAARQSMPLSLVIPAQAGIYRRVILGWRLFFMENTALAY